MVINHVRVESAAGFYLGSIEVLNGEAQPFDKDSCYYPSEESLMADYPRSISLQEAFTRGRVK